MLAFSLMAFFMFIHFILFPIVVLFISFLFFVFLFSFLKPSWFALHISQCLHMTRCCHPNITSHFTDQCHYWPSSTSHHGTSAFGSAGRRGLAGLYPLHQTDVADACLRSSWRQPHLLCLLHQGRHSQVSACVSGAAGCIPARPAQSCTPGSSSCRICTRFLSRKCDHWDASFLISAH